MATPVPMTLNLSPCEPGLLTAFLDCLWFSGALGTCRDYRLSRMLLCADLRSESGFRIGQNAIRAKMHALSQRVPCLMLPISLPAHTFVSGSTPYTPGSTHPVPHRTHAGGITGNPSCWCYLPMGRPFSVRSRPTSINSECPAYGQHQSSD